MTPRPASHARNDGRKTSRKYLLGLARIPPPTFAWSHHLRTRGHHRRTTRYDEQGPADDHDHDGQGVVLDELELDVERSPDREEEVEVGERADRGEEDLLHREAPEDPRERRAGDDRREHQHHHERAEVRRKDPVQRDGRCVAGEDLDPAHPSRVGEAEDRVPAERRQSRLRRLQHDRGHSSAAVMPVIVSQTSLSQPRMSQPRRLASAPMTTMTSAPTTHRFHRKRFAGEGRGRDRCVAHRVNLKPPPGGR